MTPVPSTPSQDGQSQRVGPHPSFIQVAKPYIFEWKIQECLNATGSEAREDNFRVQGVNWIDSVRKALQLPVRTFNTAAIYYHKFRLVHADSEYGHFDAAAAALFTACKIEDTLKKSKDILCAAHNVRVAPSEYLSSDDPSFEGPAKLVIGLERLMLEASGFDFRNRSPQRFAVKLAKILNLDRNHVGRMAYTMCIDIYKSFAPLKQSSATMAFACLELTARLKDNLQAFEDAGGKDYRKWSTSRPEVMETMLDLLDLYTHHRNATTIGQTIPIDTFINIRITLNQESSSSKYPRYTKWYEETPEMRNGTSKSHKSSPRKEKVNGKYESPKEKTRERSRDRSRSPPRMGPTSATGARGRVGERGRDGTVRFVLDAERARDEKDVVSRYFKVEEEEIEIEVERDEHRDRSEKHRPRD